jgi:hypothetical protein
MTPHIKTAEKKGQTMDFLKEILGEELFAQFAEKVNAHNGNEANKSKQIKIGNLGGGDYTSTAKYNADIDRYKAELSSKDQELLSANALIEEFKKSAKGNDALQGKITEHEATISQLQAQLEQTQIDAEIKVALLAAKATDVDYLTFKLKANNENVERGEDGKIRGIDDMIAGLKTQFPNQFEGAGKKDIIDPQPLPQQEPGGGTMTRSEFLRKPYAERAAFAKDNPDAYHEMMKN